MVDGLLTLLERAVQAHVVADVAGEGQSDLGSGRGDGRVDLRRELLVHLQMIEARGLGISHERDGLLDRCHRPSVQHRRAHPQSGTEHVAALDGFLQG